MSSGSKDVSQTSSDDVTGGEEDDDFMHLINEFQARTAVSLMVVAMQKHATDAKKQQLRQIGKRR